MKYFTAAFQHFVTIFAIVVCSMQLYGDTYSLFLLKLLLCASLFHLGLLCQVGVVFLKIPNKTNMKKVKVALLDVGGTSYAADQSFSLLSIKQPNPTGEQEPSLTLVAENSYTQFIQINVTTEYV